MKKNKPTYITDLTTEIMNNRDLLNAWAKQSVDMEFLELSVDILSNIDLLFRWDCDNVLNLKLAGIFTNNQDFTLKTGMVHKIDDSYKFPIKHSFYKKIVKALIDKKADQDLLREVLILEGFTSEEIRKKERFILMSNYMELVNMTEKYTLKSQVQYLKNLIPVFITSHKKSKKELYRKMANKFSFYENESSNSSESNLKDFTEEIWFKVGLLIATGEMETLLKTYKSARQVAIHLGIEKNRSYISDSKYSLKSNGLQKVERNTNIYSDSNKIAKIHDYCIENKIVMTDGFIEIHSKTVPKYT